MDSFTETATSKLDQMVPVSLQQDVVSVSPIILNATLVDITFSSTGGASAYLTTVRQYRQTL